MSELKGLQIVILIGTLITIGSLAVLAFNVQNSQLIYVDENDQYGRFNHPFIQTFFMFFAESLSNIVFLFFKRTKGYKAQEIDAIYEGKKRISKLKVAIPAMCDSIAGLCIYISLNFLPPSVNNIVTSGIIISSAILSKLMLKRIFTNREIIGCGFVLIGITTVGMSGFIYPEDSMNEGLNEQIMSICLLTVAVCIYGLQFNIEEKYFNEYFIHPSEMVGLEGIWGLMFYTIICSIMTFIQCPNSLQAMCIPHDGIYYFERVDYFFQQLINSHMLQLFIPIGILSIITYNTACLTVTKYLSCVTRAIVDVCKIMMLWVISLIVTYSTNSSQYHWENVRNGAIILEAIGFGVVVIGEVLYNWKEEKNKVDYMGIQ